MPNSTNFSAKTDGAHVTGTLTDHLPVNPNIPPTGLQAIGPRVTFNFITDAWSDENSYQYYDVVQVSGNSYIARQNVPTGIDISDTDYWIHWADPNAQFQELLNTVQTFDGRITENTNDIATNTAAIAKNTSDIATNTAAIAKNTADIADISKYKYIDVFADITDPVAGEAYVTSGYYEVNDGGSCLYIVMAEKPENMFSIAVKNVYLVPVNGETLNFRACGAKAGDTSFDNANLFTDIINSYTDIYVSIFVPKGIYYFNSPIDLTSKRVTLSGIPCDVTDPDISKSSVFYFNNLPGNTTAIEYTTKQNISNMYFYSNSYKLSDNRNNIGQGVDVFSETVNANNVNCFKYTDIPYGSNFENCFFRGWSGSALYVQFCNVNTCNFWECYNGITSSSDSTITNIKGFYTSNLIRCIGSNIQLSNIRSDSNRRYLIDLSNCRNIQVNNVNADYCQYSIIYGNNISNSIFSNINGRYGTIYPMDTNSVEESNLKSFVIPTDYYDKIGMFAFDGYASKGITISGIAFNVKNPLDTTSDWLCSLVLISAPHYINNASVVMSYATEALDVTNANDTELLQTLVKVTTQAGSYANIMMLIAKRGLYNCIVSNSAYSSSTKVAFTSI